MYGSGFWNYRWFVVVLGLAAAATGGCSQTKEVAEADQPAKPSLHRDMESRDGGDQNSLSQDEIERRQAVDLEELLQGRVAGVDVLETADGGFRIRIRGSRSLTGNNEPLYVVDGVPIQPMPGSGLLGLSPYDIQSIEVLKGNAAAIYGNRGANGVIMIETREP